MSTFSITGADTLTLWDRSFTDFATGDASKIDFPNDLFVMKSGKNGNTIFAKNATGNNGMLEMHLMRGSSDDAFMTQKLAELNQDPPSFILGQGTFVKRLGDGNGTVIRDTYQLTAGCIMKNPATKDNADGDTEQSVSIWTIGFAVAEKGIG